MKNQQTLPNCPSCGSSLVVRNGHIHNGKGKFACKACRRQFVENPAWKAISDETKALIDKRLLERMALAGICRVSGVSKQWLQTYVNAKYAAVEQVVAVPAQKNGSEYSTVMSYGHLWVTSTANVGYGWRWMCKPA